MKTSVIGFPRVGELRELKFATEKYWRGGIILRDNKIPNPHGGNTYENISHRLSENR